MDIQVFQMTPFVENCYVLSEDGEAIIIDAGDVTFELEEALAGLRVTMIVNTHGHCDHCGGNKRLVASTGGELACHRADWPLLSAIEQQGHMFGVSFPPSPKPQRWLEDGESLKVGATELRVIHVPGHSPGHIALVGPGMVFCGDVLFAGSIGRTDLPGGDQEQLLASIKERLIPLGDETVVYPGHGPYTTMGAERISNPYIAGLWV